MNIQNSIGLGFEFLHDGSVKSIEADPIRISLKKASDFSMSGANIFLRKRSNPYEYVPLTGPVIKAAHFTGHDYFMVKGTWSGIEYTCTLQLSGKSMSWQWSIEIDNTSGNETEIDLFYLQDVGLKTLSNGMVNEYYVSQYIERLILEDSIYGKVVCCRQNMKESDGHPWLMIACKNSALAASTDGMQFFGKSFRATGVPEGLLNHLLGGEYAGESSYVALQTKAIVLGDREKYRVDFVAKYLADHSSASSFEDLNMLPDLLMEFDNTHPDSRETREGDSDIHIFKNPPFLLCDDLDDDELSIFFGKERGHLEKLNGQILSFFSQENNHIVLKAKELLVDRPHGHIMQAKAGLVPDESIVSTNTFAYGVFNSHLTQGNTNFNIFLSVCSSQFNTSIETGQRIFVNIAGEWHLLGVPSAYEIGLNHSRWIYKHEKFIFQIRSWTSKKASQVNLDFKVIKGDALDILITHHFDEANGWIISPGESSTEFVGKPKPESLIACKFSNSQFRILIQDAAGEFESFRHKETTSSFFILDITKTASFCMSILGEVPTPARQVVIVNSDEQWLKDCKDARSAWASSSLNISLNGNHKDIAAIQRIIPWYGLNALIHYLTPYGLEQFGGAAWGTRDVSQGPIDMLLNLEKYEETRKIIHIIFSNQNPDGSWPQWWMFDSYTTIRANEAHGDIVYWCIIALCNYIKVTGDFKILDDILPYYAENASPTVERTPLREHVDRLINMIVDSFIPGTSLVPFGGGDWNDSLQPVNEELARRMISAWTVEMNYQAFSQYQEVSELMGLREKANELKGMCANIKSDFNKHLVRDGIVAGYGLVEEDRSISLLPHPTDKITGIHYSILPMNRGIICEIFSKETALFHQELIEKQLKGPDGARLMDRPLKYRGGIQKIFQRAESSAYFGREIGLMYVHEHIRYAESLAIMGKAKEFIKALRQAIPVDYREIVPSGDVRQSNCYYSSSDVVFRNRYDADTLYDMVKTGMFTLRGGWRVYSSGPGIFIGLIISRLLGLRVEFGKVILDPVMPESFNGLSARLIFRGKPIEMIYYIRNREYGPDSILINGKPASFARESSSYREGGLQIPLTEFLEYLNRDNNEIIIHL